MVAFDQSDHAVIIYSGGMDSFTLLNDIVEQLKHTGIKFHALSFDYGQRHRKELDFAISVCDDLFKAGVNLSHVVINLKGLASLLGGSALTDNSIPVPEGHYEDATMATTVVPGRNTIMLSMALGYAEALANKDNSKVVVYYGAHSGDHAIYPDCRPSYIHAMQLVFLQSSEEKVALQAPYKHLTKGGILKIGLDLKLNYACSWTCYKGEEHPCGVCGACTERHEAFLENKATDPWFPPLPFNNKGL